MDLFFVHIVGGLLVLPSYFYYLPKIQSDNLWVDMPQNLRTVFTFSIVIAVVSFIIGMWVGRKNPKLKLAFLIFYIGAALWPPMVYYKNKSMVFIALCLTTFGALLLTLWSPKYIFFFIVFCVASVRAML